MCLYLYINDISFLIFITKYKQRINTNNIHSYFVDLYLCTQCDITIHVIATHVLYLMCTYT